MTDTVAQFIAAAILFAVAGGSFALGYRLGRRRPPSDAQGVEFERRPARRKPGEALPFRPPKRPPSVH